MARQDTEIKLDFFWDPGGAVGAVVVAIVTSAVTVLDGAVVAGGRLRLSLNTSTSVNVFGESLGGHW